MISLRYLRDSSHCVPLEKGGSLGPGAIDRIRGYKQSVELSGEVLLLVLVGGGWLPLH